jgi:hypothetical protein
MPQKSMYILTNTLGQRLTIAPNAPLTKWRIIIARFRDTSREGYLSQHGTHRNAVQKSTSSWSFVWKFFNNI